MTPIADDLLTNPKRERGPDTSPKRQQGCATTTASQPKPIGSIAEIAEPSGTNESHIMQALQEYRTAREAGANPNRQEFLTRHADIVNELAHCLEALDFVYEAAPKFQDSALEPGGPLQTSEVSKTSEVSADAQPPMPLGDYQIIREIGRGGMGVVYEAIQLSLGRRVALKVLPLAGALDARHLQRFKNEAHAAAHLQHQNIVPVYFVGCERGVHFYAMQYVEGQTLAALIQELRQQRGLHERGSTGEPGCVSARSEDGPASRVASAPGAKIEDRESQLRAGIPDAVPTGPYTQGNQESATVEERGVLNETVSASPRSSILDSGSSFFRTVANLGIQAAEALEHAHQLGVIHRDIKPANLMVENSSLITHHSSLRLWITDFGLAQCLGAADLTMTGDLIGTLRYMSPEQAMGKRVMVDHRTDIYSLGASLYELLTLEPVFSGRDRQELLRQIAFEEAKPPRRMNKAIPAELETILLKALEKNPAERYGTAQELADDLERFLKDEPIRAKRPSLLQRGRKWTRRHRPVVNSVLVATAVFVTIGIVALLFSLDKVSGALREKTAALTEKSAALEREIETTYLRGIALAGRELAAGNVGRAEELLEECPEHLRGWEWHFLKRQRYYGNPSPMQLPATVVRVAFSPDGRQIASVCLDGTFQVWDARTSRVLHTLERQMVLDRGALVRGMAYSPDSRYLALTRHDGTVRVWDATRGQSLYTLEGHKGPSWQVAFSPDSRTLASCGSDRSVRLWDVISGQALQVFSEHPAAVKGVAFRPDGRSLVAACDEGTVKVWDRDTGRETFSFRGELLAYPFSPWFSPDGWRLAWSCLDGVIKIWDTTTGRLEIDQQSNTHQCRAVAFSPDGKRIALAGFDGTLRLLDGTTGREMLTIFAHPSLVADAAFSHDGNKLASASYDHTVRIWDATPLDGDPLAAHCVTLTGHKQLVSGVAFSPDGHWLASSSWDGTVKLWETSVSGTPAEFTLRYTLRGHSGNVIGVAFSSDRRTLASGSWDKTVKLWDLHAPVGDSLTETRTIPCAERVTGLALSPNGRLLAVGQTNGIALYDPATGKEVTPFKRTPAPVPAVTFSPDSRRLVSAGASDPAIKVWDLAGEKPPFEIRHYSNPNASVAFSPDGRLIASPGRDHAAGGPTVKVWDAQTHKALRTLTGHTGYVWKVTFSPDGRYLASGSWDSTIKVWDLEAPESAEPVTLRGHAGFIHGLAFSPDGRRLASASGSARHGEVKVWDATLWEKKASGGR